MSGGKTSMPQEFKQLADIGRGMLRNARPFINEQLRQGLEAQRTGGVRAKIPLIQQAVSQSRQAMGRALTGTAEDLAARNIGGPFAARALAQTRLSGEQATAAIPTNIAEQVIARTSPIAMSSVQAGLGGISQAGQASFAADAFSAQQFAKLMGDIRESIMGSASMASGCLHPDTNIETPTGAYPVSTLRPGDTVWTMDKNGDRVPATVIEQAERVVGWDWQLMEVEAPGGRFFVSPSHPDATGFALGNSLRGRILTGLTDRTYDIAVDGPTGLYFVNGMALASTLDLCRWRVRRVA